LRISHLFDNFYWRYQMYYLATWCFTQYYTFEVLRILGILLITFQRYVTMCCSGSISTIFQWLNTSKRWIVVCVHWVLPFAYIMPVVGRNEVTFVDMEYMQLNVTSSLVLVSRGKSIQTTLILLYLFFGIFIFEKVYVCAYCVI
uniref:XK-related protein n=1 Tax=Angiostrongylus cantonensis TaxID=6313 RepID=A0A0K0DPD2_ANGCA